MSTRVYCNGTLTKAVLTAKLDEGLVLVDIARDGYTGGDVAYFRTGTEAEILYCRTLMASSTLPEAT